VAFLDTLNRLLGDPNEKELKKLRPSVPEVRKWQQEFQVLQLQNLPKKTEEFRARIAAGTSIDVLLPEAFGLVIRACELLVGTSVTMGRQEFRWDMVPFDVQIIGGIALHRGGISEMRTGEGKTLVCTMPVYLNALLGKGVHVVTVNDYLARRDATWMGMLYSALGLSVGTIVHGLTFEERKSAYASDVTYGTNNEFGFDYLRDNMASQMSNQVQRGLHYAIVDEVDSILIDEARTPLIISQAAEESTSKYQQYARLVSALQEHTHYVRDEKQRAATLTEEGIKHMEGLLGVENIYTEKGFEEVHHIEQALRAHAIYQRDVDYVVKDGEVVIVDEFTGRLMPGRRYSHGLHQAIEAKEGVEVQRESRTLATITFQNYFRLYRKLAGMTGTAKTEEEEFESIYRLRTIVIPTHRSMVRADNSDMVYRSVAAKFKAVAAIAKEKHTKGQPILIGTTSIEKSEVMSKLLEQEGIPHQVLNAKHHEREAEIVAKAGQRGAVTIATNMAGRGTDIKLGSDVASLGGLCILGTERHEARRIDNQLRGRAGRQGDPGESQFFVSMEDDLMRLFGGDRLKSMMERLQVPDDQPLQSRIVSRSIESAQKRVEGHNFDMRRHVLQYDDVMNKHREIIYKRRQKILEKLDDAESGEQGDQSVLHEDVRSAIKAELQQLVLSATRGDDPEQWGVTDLHENITTLHPTFREVLSLPSLRQFEDRDQMLLALTERVLQFYEEKCKVFEQKIVALAERVITLRSIDTHWMNHIDAMAHLREQVAFSGFAQRDPLIEYQDQGFRTFQQLLATINSAIAKAVLQVEFAQFQPRLELQRAEEELLGVQTNEAQIEEGLGQTGVDSRDVEPGSMIEIRPTMPAHRIPSASIPSQVAARKVGRNDPCPCGALHSDGRPKKYKHCHGQ
jgi:preprotein translocase subunit SecA